MKELAENHSAWEHNFDEQIRQVHQQLCEDPSRRHRKDCEDFLANHSSPQPASASRGLRGTVGQAQSSGSVDEGLGLLRSSPSPGRGLRGSAPRQQGQLRWLTVAESLTSRTLGTRRLTVRPEAIQHADWLGEIPKVACITAIPIGQATKHSINEFVENFREQTTKYGGPTQLVLVYHFEDEKAADLVHLHADGAFIKGIAARGVGDFPSTADLRFGAYSAADDAQVLVHWDFEASHSPERLHLQVRAMAYSGRPASLLQGGGWRENGSQDDTIAGYRTFIWKHWYPRLAEPLGIDEGKLVVVDMKQHLI